MNKSRVLENITNVAILLVILLIGLSFYRNYSQSHRPEVKVGDKLKIPGESIDKKTLLVAISTQCHFCTESAPFYKRLVNSSKGIRIVALAQESLPESKSYLQQLQVPINDVKQVSFMPIHISGTPTLVLLNDRSEVAKVWKGKLSPSVEDEVLRVVECGSLEGCN